MAERPRAAPDAAAAAARLLPRGAVATAARANLFRSQLTRRPTAGSASTSAETLRLDADALPGAGGDIVVRNQQGEIDLGDPPAPAVPDHDEQAEDRLETEKERQRLADAVKHHAVNHSSVPDQPEGGGPRSPPTTRWPTLTRRQELLEAVRADLRAKVNALADDNWMFEPEEPTRG